MVKRITTLLIIPGSLILGVQVYIHSRANDLVLHEMLRGTGLLAPDNVGNSFFTRLDLPDWLLNSLPDGLWMLALSLVILLIWNFKINHNSIIWLGIALTVGLALELSQAIGFMPGTFDWMDVVLIVLGAALPVAGCLYTDIRGR